jgi:hypothetical protein
MSLMDCPECRKQISDQAEACPSCGFPIKPGCREPAFQAHRKRVFAGNLIICIICLPIGLYLKQPFVWILCIFGIIVCVWKLKKMSEVQQR